MRQCLTNPEGGYYTTTRPASDQFGKKGDFITSPEISQVFGELVGIWFMTEWMAQGRPREGVQFMEVGPGRGTLMADVLRTIAQFRTFAGAVDSVWLVEAGEGLRKQQKNLLCGGEAEMKEVNDGDGRTWWESRSRFGNGIPVRWVEDIALLPKNDESAPKMPFIMAHEFFDALPIHAFESVAPDPNAGQTDLLDKHGNPMIRQSSANKTPQWRELLVAPTKRKLNFAATPSSSPSSPQPPNPDFSLVLAKASNPISLVLPERPRYKHLKSHAGSRIEVSPESSRYIQDFARRIGGTSSSSSRPAGAALIIDYGPLDTIPVNSLRGIKSHAIVSPFLYAGQADISADVDFVALADSALEASLGVEVHGPVEQGMWLSQLGIKERAERLVKGVAGSEEKKTDLETGWKRLVEGGPKGMGKAYKVMAILPENGGQRRPVGFGGDIAV
ncbi:hypothetical protein R6Q59_009883 [Mikania micrantha]